MEAQSHLLTVITFLPLLSVPRASVAALGGPHLDPPHRAWRLRSPSSLSRSSCWPGFALASPNYQFDENHGWIGPSIHYHIGVDGISLFLVLLTTFLTPLAILCSWNSIQQNVKGFFLSLLVIETAMIGVFVSLDLVPLLRLLGAHADPHVFHDRHLGSRAANLRGGEIHFVHDVRLDSDARRDSVALQRNAYVRPDSIFKPCCNPAAWCFPRIQSC